MSSTHLHHGSLDPRGDPSDHADLFLQIIRDILDFLLSLVVRNSLSRPENVVEKVNLPASRRWQCPKQAARTATERPEQRETSLFGCENVQIVRNPSRKVRLGTRGSCVSATKPEGSQIKTQHGGNKELTKEGATIQT